jgi:glycerate dehydrogenase
MKAVFLDYDTVSHGDLDTSALSAAAGDLELCDSDDARIAARVHDADIVLLNRAEPPQDGEPLLEPGIPNLIVTPHVAWAAQEARQRCLDEMAANIRDFLAGGRRSRVV